MERIFDTDRMSKLDRVRSTIEHKPVDRVAIHDQVSYNPDVIRMYTGREIDGFAYGIDDIALVIRRTLDMCFPPVAPRGTARVTTDDGFVVQHDNWTTWHVSRPFTDEHGARDWLLRKIAALKETRGIDAGAARSAYRRDMLELQAKVGDTVILNYSGTPRSAPTSPASSRPPPRMTAPACSRGSG
ncbi:MAG TPA: hypothetical protein VM186_13755 [Planctomycetota bacterium]|nr:hypothetical protein [Planctomycetota bacterium]